MKIPLNLLLFLLVFSVFSCRNAEQKRESRNEKIAVTPLKKLTALDTLLSDLEILKKDTSLRHASLSYVINDYSTGRPVPVTSSNADMSMVPASVMKVLTTAAALEILGEGRSFRTSLQYDGIIENHIPGEWHQPLIFLQHQ